MAHLHCSRVPAGDSLPPPSEAAPKCQSQMIRSRMAQREACPRGRRRKNVARSTRNLFWVHYYNFPTYTRKPPLPTRERHHRQSHLSTGNNLGSLTYLATLSSPISLIASACAASLAPGISRAGSGRFFPSLWAVVESLPRGAGLSLFFPFSSCLPDAFFLHILPTIYLLLSSSLLPPPLFLNKTASSTSAPPSTSQQHPAGGSRTAGTALDQQVVGRWLGRGVSYEPVSPSRWIPQPHPHLCPSPTSLPPSFPPSSFAYYLPSLPSPPSFFASSLPLHPSLPPSFPTSFLLASLPPPLPTTFPPSLPLLPSLLPPFPSILLCLLASLPLCLLASLPPPLLPSLLSFPSFLPPCQPPLPPSLLHSHRPSSCRSDHVITNK
ncbi:hypothetical protein C7M84_004546 [Penaeus vannamei]|uniref:Uncharacterized protein n=1 Tax=Penaeus vannamei TaxID=6689 RepID=A0A423TK72_PENVA|nr:hypothetical protein C7M84_004546 [Penaeus vannamei]